MNKSIDPATRSKRPYLLRLLADHSFYDERLHSWRSWRAGQIVGYSVTVKLLETRGAAVERVYES